MFPKIIVILIVISLVALCAYFDKKQRARRGVQKAVEEMIREVQEYAIPAAQKKRIDSASFSSLKALVEKGFSGLYISDTEEERLKQRFAKTHDSAVKLLDQAYLLTMEDQNILGLYVNEYNNLDAYIREHNKLILDNILTQNKEFFDTVLKYPLDNQQRRAIISEADNCLVVSSAGSGKTSSIMGKVQYLIKKKHIDPKKILLISYTNKAAAELTSRLDAPGLRGYTFHKLALDIISEENGVKPSICENTASVFVGVFRQLIKDEEFQNHIVQYFIDFEEFLTEEEKAQNLKREELKEEKEKTIRALLPDMDDRTIYVRSEQERKICFALSSLGMKFRYEASYEHNVADNHYSQYKPDFTIFYEKDGEEHRAYLEHFAIDEHEQVPEWFATACGITFEEANKKYNDGISWKREIHQQMGTTLLETRSADFRYYDIKDHLKKIFTKAGIPYRDIPVQELYEQILPPESGQEKVFIKLLVTFISLVKANCNSIDDILVLTRKNKDERSEFIIDHLIRPMYEGYRRILEERREMDFTDLIIQATEICRQKPRDYGYIIVDEFQDISMDRYRFLKVLRECVNGRAKLFCVGDDWQSIYRFSGSDMSLFCDFERYFGKTETCKIETTYRFGEPMVSLSSWFIQRNPVQIRKQIRPFNNELNTSIQFYSYRNHTFANCVNSLVGFVPADKSVIMIGRYSFDDMRISSVYPHVNRGGNVYYTINGREVEFLTAHKSKGLEADYVILLNCNSGTFGFPSTIEDDPVIKYTLGEADQYAYGEERRLFYVAITRAKIKTMVMYDEYHPSIFVDEVLHPEISANASAKNGARNADKQWERREDHYLRKLYIEKVPIEKMATKLGRSRTAIMYRIKKLKEDGFISDSKTYYN